MQIPWKCSNQLWKSSCKKMSNFEQNWTSNDLNAKSLFSNVTLVASQDLLICLKPLDHHLGYKSGTTIAVCILNDIVKLARNFCGNLWCIRLRFDRLEARTLERDNCGTRLEGMRILVKNLKDHVCQVNTCAVFALSCVTPEGRVVLLSDENLFSLCRAWNTCSPAPCQMRDGHHSAVSPCTSPKRDLVLCSQPQQ